MTYRAWNKLFLYFYFIPFFKIFVVVVVVVLFCNFVFRSFFFFCIPVLVDNGFVS